MVLFAWLVMQEYFKEMTDQDIRRRIYEEQRNQIEQDMAPFGFIMDGTEEESFVDADGDRWHVDEYGDRSYYVGLSVMDLDEQFESGHLFFNRELVVSAERQKI